MKIEQDVWMSNIISDPPGGVPKGGARDQGTPRQIICLPPWHALYAIVDGGRR